MRLFFFSIAQRTRFSLALSMSLALLLGGVIMASAQEKVFFPITNPALSLSYPSDWTVKPEKSQVRAQPPSGMLWLTLEELSRKKSVEELSRDAAMQVAGSINNLHVDNQQTLKVGDNTFLIVNGTGRMRGSATPMLVKAAFFQSPDQRKFLFLYYGTRNSVKEFEKQLASILESIEFKNKG